MNQQQKKLLLAALAILALGAGSYFVLGTGGKNAAMVNNTGATTEKKVREVRKEEPQKKATTREARDERAAHGWSSPALGCLPEIQTI